MNAKRMPKKPVKKPTESDDDITVESDSYNTETDEVSSQVSNEEVVEETIEEEEEIEESDDNDNENGYIESDNESEQDLMDGEVKDEDICEYDEDVPLDTGTTVLVAKEDRITRPVMTKYEKVRVLGERAKQISSGAPVYIKGVENKTPYEIAELELKHGLIPFIIRRPLPDKSYEEWKISELKVQ